METKNYFEILQHLVEVRNYSQLRETLSEMQYVDVALVIGQMEKEDALCLFRLLPKDMAADVFANLDSDDQRIIIESLNDPEASNIINNLYVDDAIDFLEEMPANVAKKMLAIANQETRSQINHLLQYPEDSAGSVMTVEYIDLKQDMTIAQAIEKIRRIGLDSETVNICYVLDSKRVLVGTVALRYLLLLDSDAVIGEVMNDNVISINTLDDQEVAAKTLKKYDFTAMPVVDAENRMVGIITIDDVVDILEEEATEDIEKMAAIIPNDRPYLKTGIFETYKKRMPWLLFLMISATFTGAIISSFENALSKCVLLTRRKCWFTVKCFYYSWSLT